MQLCKVHVNVGTANGMNGLLNAARGHVPVLFTAGRTPTNEDGLAGHRSLDIHWTQEMFDQAGMLRESVKWDYELRNGQQLETVVDRALTIAKSEPMGPVYLSLPREVLAQTMDEFTYTTPSRQHPAAPAFPNGGAIDEVAALLAGADNPLIITSSAGRDPKAWTALGTLAERYAIPVIQYRNRYMSIPSNHPMNLGYELSPLLDNADVILAIDVPVPDRARCGSPSVRRRTRFQNWRSFAISAHNSRFGKRELHMTAHPRAGTGRAVTATQNHVNQRAVGFEASRGAVVARGPLNVADVRAFLRPSRKAIQPVFGPRVFLRQSLAREGVRGSAVRHPPAREPQRPERRHRHR